MFIRLICLCMMVTSVVASDKTELSLLRSIWKPSPAIMVPSKGSSEDLFEDPEQFYSPENSFDDSSNPTPKHVEVYLSLDLLPSDTKTCQLYEKFLVTYCRLVIDEKKYGVRSDLKSKLAKKEQYSLGTTQEYLEWVKFSHRMNSWLPSRETPVLQYVRGWFTQRWPIIDMYDDLEFLRARSPSAGLYLDYLFKTNSPEVTISNITEGVINKCAGQMARLDVITLFALHTFGHGDFLDLELAYKELIKLDAKADFTGLVALYEAIKNHHFDLRRGLIFSDNDVKTAFLLSDDDMDE